MTFIALIHGPDQPGLVARAASWIYEHGGTILHADQHRDAEADLFVQRLEWMQPDDADPKTLPIFQQTLESMGMQVRLLRSDQRPRIGVLVSKIPHCYQDLVLRWRQGELPGDIVCTISNHPDMEAFSRDMKVPVFHHVPIDPANKEAAEDRQLHLFQDNAVDLVVMARYMQILSPRFLEKIGCPVINIHHSFLPAFAGGRPYHQAYERGVKIIGATAHYATEDLDEGPIIAQDVTRISHRHSVEDLIRKGRDLEKAVFAQAVRAHLQGRVLAYGRKTVVFD